MQAEQWETVASSGVDQFDRGNGLFDRGNGLFDRGIEQFGRRKGALVAVPESTAVPIVVTVPAVCPAVGRLDLTDEHRSPHTRTFVRFADVLVPSLDFEGVLVRVPLVLGIRDAVPVPLVGLIGDGDVVVTRLSDELNGRPGGDL